MRTLTSEILKRRWPHGDQHIPRLIEGIVSAAPMVFPRYELVSALLVAHAMAQFSEECGQGLELVESLKYSAAGLLRTWPKHFTPSMAERWAYNEQMIGEIAYGGRMGNSPPPSTDGYDFRGRGLSQVTGREGYAKLRAILKENGTDVDIVGDPGLIVDPHYALECGVADWVLCGCRAFAGNDDIEGETKALNGGVLGLDERKRQLELWKSELME